MEIYFNDLTKDAQTRLLKEAGVKGPEEMNWNVFPVTITEVEGVDFEPVESVPGKEETEKNEEKEFWVSMKIDGRYHTPVRATDLETAAEKAKVCFIEADFGELECIDSEIVNITDEDDNIHDYMGGGQWS